MAFAFLLTSDQAFAEPVTLAFEGALTDEYALTFDSSIISEASVRKLVRISPEFYHDYYMAPSLENCSSVEERYGPCGSRDIKDLNYFKNAQVNIKKGKELLEGLNDLEAPKELFPVVDYMKESLAFDLWLEETRLDFYGSWDAGVLKRKYKNLDPQELCGEALKKIEDAKDTFEKYRLARYRWHNCLNRVFRNKMGKYPYESWSGFLDAYKIKEDMTGSAD